MQARPTPRLGLAWPLIFQDPPILRTNNLRDQTLKNDQLLAGRGGGVVCRDLQVSDQVGVSSELVRISTGLPEVQDNHALGWLAPIIHNVILDQVPTVALDWLIRCAEFPGQFIDICPFYRGAVTVQADDNRP